MKKYFLFLLALFVSLQLFAQESKLPVFIADSLDIYVNRALKDWRIPGVSVAIVKDGKVVLTKGYGVCDMNKPDKVDENTLFLIGSNSKAFTGTAIAMLDTEGKLRLDEKVTKYMPEFKLRDPLASQEVSVRDLLCHRIGMETFQGDFVNWTSNLTRKDVMHNLSVLVPTYSFRAKWGYCNAAFLTAGEIIPLVTPMSWEQFMRERFFKPLEMSRTLALTKEMAAASNKCSSHTIYDGKLIVIPTPDIDNLAPAASIVSSAADMSHWVMMLLQDGKYNGKEVVAPAAIRASRVPSSIIGNSRSRFNRSNFRLYGLGWDLMDYEARSVVSHTGGVDGFVTSVTLVPAEKLGVVVLTNTDQNAFYEALKWEIVDAFLGLPYRNYSGEYLKRFSKNQDDDAAWLKAKRDTVAMKNAPALALEKFTGKFINEAYGPVEVSVVNSLLSVNMSRHPGMTAKLEALGGNRFLCTYSNPTFGIRDVYFTVEGKSVKSLTLYCADFVDFLPYTFVKD
jgi:CubicO group peptidase (beta-lactamase class C family)